MVKIFIGTPTIDQKVNVGYLNTILGLEQLKPDYVFNLFTLGGNSMITDARNQIASIFLNTDNDYLFFLDSDVEVNPIDVKLIIDSGLDVVGIPVMKKNFVQPKVNMGNILEDTDSSLVKVSGISTSALLVSRKAIESFKDRPTYKAVVTDIIDSSNRNIPVFYDIFKAEPIDGSFLSEDYRFCYDLKEKGFDTHVFLNSTSNHYGTVPFSYRGA